MNQRKIGVILSYLSMGANSLIALVYVPMLLHYLTKDQYGIYQLMGSLIAYLSIMDFGLANTTTRYLSRAYAKHDKTLADQIISTSYALYLAIAVVLVAMGGIFYHFITPLYGKTLSSVNLTIAKNIFLILLFNVAITIPSHIFTASINANERFVFLRGLNLIKVLIQPLLVWGILAWKASVLNLVLVQTGFSISVIFLNYLYCKYKLHIVFFVNFKNKPLMKELTGFSFFVFLHALMDQLYWRLGQLVLGAVSGPVAVANYAIVMQLTTFSIFMPVTMSGVFLPKLSSIATQSSNLTEIDAIFCKIGRLQFMFIMLLWVGFAFLGKTFIILWIGPGYDICYTITLLLMGAYVLDVTQNVGIPILQALKKHAFRAYIYTAMAILNFVLTIVLGRLYGEMGCAVATAICLCLGPGVAINWYYQHIGINLKLFFQNIFQLCRPIVCACVVIMVGFYLIPLAKNWISFISHGVVLTFFFVGFLWLFGLNEYEKNLFLDPLKKLKHKFLNS